MNSILVHVRRYLALALTFVFLATSTNFGLMSRASAATYVTKTLYTILAENYFSGTNAGDKAAAGILTSGALKNDQTIRMAVPGAADITFSDGKLTASEVSSSYSNLRWTPYSCKVNGREILFNGGSTVTISDQGSFEPGVEYRMVLTNIGTDVLNIPYTLMEEASDQRYVLDKLVDPDEPYMDYMKKLTHSQMGTLYDLLNPTGLLADKVVLNSNSKKNTALKNSFRDVITKMRSNCYGTDGTLTIYSLLLNYENDRLSYYYQNNEAFHEEIELFSGYLDNMLKAEIRDGAFLNSNDKKAAIEKLVTLAKQYGPALGISVPDFAVDFEVLQQKMTTVKGMLTTPNDLIDVNSATLGTLTKALETGASVSQYNEHPTLSTVIVVSCCNHIYDNDADSTCNGCGAEREVDSGNTGSGEGDSGNTGSGEGDSGNTGSGEGDSGNTGSGEGDSGNTGSGEGDSGNTGSGEGDSGNTGSGEGDSGNTGSGEGDSGNAGSGEGDSGNAGSGEVDSGNTGSDDSGAADDDAAGSESGSGTTTIAVGSSSSLANRITEAGAGDSIQILKTITMTEDVPVSSTITINGASRLDDAGYALTLSDPEARIEADGALNVTSSVDGYVAVKSESSYTYTLAEIASPDTAGDVAGSKTEKLNETRYLFLDLDPNNGMTLNAFAQSAAYAELDGYTLSFTVEGNDGSKLLKTADRLVVAAKNDDGKTVAQITYTVIVMGDSNCNGRVNSSDAAVTKNISMGKESSLEARMASDVNFSGSVEKPKINSSDVAYTMAKWFAWDLDKYVSNMK